MNRDQLIQAVNQQLSSKPLIFFCREVERAIGLEKILTNFHICCVEDSALVDNLIANKVSVFCLEKYKQLEHKTTSSLLSQSETLNWLKQIAPSGFYALTFLPTKPLEFKIQNLGGILLQSTFDLNQKFEEKLNQITFFKKYNLPIPPQKAINLEPNYEDLKKEFETFVIQMPKSHTGVGTFIIRNEISFSRVLNSYQGNLVKVSKYIAGMPFTVNACVTENKTYLGSIQYQITGIAKLNAGEGTTVGNDFSYGDYIFKSHGQELYEKLRKLVNDVGNGLRAEGYKGLFGIDVIIKVTGQSEIYLIEINARQTANIPFENKLVLSQTQKSPLQLISIASFLGIINQQIEDQDLTPLNGAQIFLRSPKDNLIIQFEYKSGIYRLQSDNASVDWEEKTTKDNVIFLDEDQDKPLIYLGPGYSIDDIKSGGFNLQFQKQNNIKNKYEEIARMQFNNQIVYNGQVSPWIIEALSSIQGQVI